MSLRSSVFTVLIATSLAGGGVHAIPCPDVDGDLWGVSAGVCETTGLFGLGDCDDGDPLVNPGAVEICGDDTDNDCDGDVDFGLREPGLFEDPDTGLLEPVEGLCFITDPPGCTHVTDCVPDANCCVTAGTKQCNANLDGVICVSNSADQSINEVEPEGPAGAANCFDFTDNDCDGCYDHQDPVCQSDEFCNGFDDDYDGPIDEDFLLGTACVVGIGSCERAGNWVCDGAGGRTCSAVSGVPVAEFTPGRGVCVDGLDNDCDGFTDLADAGCQEQERCDGLDNDGNGLIDEPFADLGSACSVAIGQCGADGSRICAADGSGTVCNAVPDLSASGPEGPAGVTCTDDTDNDCDGLVDAADPGCASANVAASCSLELLQNVANGSSCEGHYRIHFDTSQASADAAVFAELLALDASGNLLAVLPVLNDEVAHLNSRLDPDDWKFRSKPNKRRGRLAGPGNRHEIYAPVPLLRVRVRDGVNEASAYCSPIPWLDVVRPDGAVVDGTGGENLTEVLAALPQIDVGSLTVTVNGVDVFAELGIDPLTAFPGAHPGGSVTIDGQNVTISGIVVDIAPDIETPSSNTLRMNVSGLACGGSEVVIAGTGHFPADTVEPLTEDCHVDDLHDCGGSTVFELTIESPTPGEITNVTPTPVSGEVCHGLEVIRASINGKLLDLSDPAFTASTGECGSGTYSYTIDTALEQTNLFAEAIGASTALGTFDAGSNRLIASATDAEARRVFDTFVFTIGDPEDLIFGTARGPGQRGVLDEVAEALRAGSLDLEDAFVFGLDESALQAFFDSTCAGAEVCLKEQLREYLEQCPAKAQMCSGGGFDGFIPCIPPLCELFGGSCVPTDLCQNYILTKIEIDDACDPWVAVRVLPGSLEFLEPVLCDVALTDGSGPDGTGGSIGFALTVPQLTFAIHVDGHCDGFAYAVNVNVDAGIQVTLPAGDGARSTVTFEIVEENFVEPPAPLSDPVLTLGSGVVDAIVTDPGDTGAGGWIVATIDAVVGQIVSTDQLFGIPVGFAIENADLFQSLGPGANTIVIQIPQVTPDDVTYGETGKSMLPTFSDARINGEGLTAVTEITVESLLDDPEVEVAPGLKTPAPIPMPPVDGGNSFVAISDDLLNGIFIAATAQGDLASECVGPLATGTCCVDTELATVDDLFPTYPDDCDDPDLLCCNDPDFLTDNEATNLAIIGTCLGIHAADLPDQEAEDLCESIDEPDRDRCVAPGDPFDCCTGPQTGNFCNSIRRAGQATCHGVRGANCSQIPVDALITGERTVCDQVPPLNIKASDAILLCARTEIPPAFLIADEDPDDDRVDARVRLNDLLVSVLVDRADDGFDGGLVTTIPGCLDSATDADCALLGVCLDSNFKASLFAVERPTGLGLKFDLGDPIGEPRPAGEICEGQATLRYNYDAETTEGAAESDPLAEDLRDNAAGSVPLQAPKNIDLGGLVRFETPSVFAIKTGSETGRCANDLDQICITDTDCGGEECIVFQDYLGVRGTIVAEEPPSDPQCNTEAESEPAGGAR